MLTHVLSYLSYISIGVGHSRTHLKRAHKGVSDARAHYKLYRSLLLINELPKPTPLPVQPAMILILSESCHSLNVIFFPFFHARPPFLRLIVRSGNSSTAPLLFDSDLDDVPERGFVSEGMSLYVELTADSSSIPLLLALRYEGKTSCYTFNKMILFSVQKEPMYI